MCVNPAKRRVDFEMNPGIKSLGSGFANLDSRVCQSGLVRNRDLRIFIFKDLFCGIVLKICEDSLDL